MRLKLVCGSVAIAFLSTAAVQAAPGRPKILGISHIAVYSSNPAATDHFYRVDIGAEKAADPENPQGARYMLSATQFVEVLPLPAGAGIERLDHTAWRTMDAEAMRRYLATKGWKTPDTVKHGSDGSLWFEVRDPEGNKVQFVQPGLEHVSAPKAIGDHMIHVGFMVHNRGKEDTFYRGLLGFRPYWYGGMHPGKVDWVSQQVPDGRDWLEYMMTPGSSGIPEGMTQQRLGVLEHFSIGEASVPAAYKVLVSGNRLSGRHSKAPEIGLDGKYQYDFFDPDGIRIELMNFHATKKPCCSPFTAPDPVH